VERRFFTDGQKHEAQEFFMPY